MTVTGLYHVLVTDTLARSRMFYEEHFGLRPVFVADWYVQLAHPTQPGLQLALVVAGHETIPAGDQRPNRSAIVTIEVDDGAPVFERLQAAGTSTLGAPRDEPWGQRHFFAIDPAGFLVDVVMPIEPSAEYAAAHVPAL